MALDKDILGQALHDARQVFNDTPMDQLLQTYGTLDGVRLAMAKADAAAIITHFTANAVIPGAGLVAPNGPVTGATIIT